MVVLAEGRSEELASGRVGRCCWQDWGSWWTGSLRLAWRMPAVAVAAWQGKSRRRRMLYLAQTGARAVASGGRGGNPHL